MNRGTIPSSEAIAACQCIHARLVKMADHRSIVYRPRRAFGNDPHWRTYWGYLRDARVMVRIGNTIAWTIDKQATFDEEWLATVRELRNLHRQNAALTKFVRSSV